jgi:predicted DNA binding CopG/RHH family protein
MTNDPADPIDFSEMENRCPSLFDMIDLANSLPSVMDNAALEELLNRAPLIDPTPPTTFDTNASSERITIRLAGEVWKAYREAAARRGVGYQTLINDTLRQAIPGLAP